MSDPVHPIYTVESRCFVPFPIFGGGFSGDNRGFSVTADSSARVHAIATISPDTAAASKVRAYSDTTHGPLGVAANAQPEGTIDAHAVQGGAQYNMHSFGSNPVLMGLAPDIDNHAHLDIRQQAGSMTIAGNFTGDKFPASEWTLRDASGQGLFIGGHMPTEKGEVFSKLFGDFERPTASVLMDVSVDKKGNFERVVAAELKGPDGKVIASATNVAVSEWNSAVMKALTPPGMPSPEVNHSKEHNQQSLGNTLQSTQQTNLIGR